MNTPEDDAIVIVAAKRTAIGKFGGYFANVSATQLGSTAISAAVTASTLNPDHVGEVYMGCVLPAGLGQAPARQAAIGAGLSQHIGCTTINKVCGSGMKSIMLGYDAIKAGAQTTVIAGGMENMSRAPYLLPQGRFGYRFGHGSVQDHMLLDGLEDAYDRGRPMGYFAEACAQQYAITRQQQDAYALASVERAQQAIQQQHFQHEIAAVTITDRQGAQQIDTDEGPLTAKPAKIPTLKPAFSQDGTITAANSSSISDGAAAVILMHQSTAEKHHCPMLAKVIGYHTHAQEPAWFTTAPIHAITGLLKKINWHLDDVDLFEINEAFAVVTLVTLQELKLPADKVNIHGGACVLGHPIGASGARIVVTLIHALRARNLKKGVAALCIGGGEATALAIELL